MSNKLYVGQSGLHQIASILAIRGYNFAIPTVDDGKDIVSMDNNKIFSIQIKSSKNPTETKSQVSFDLSIQNKFCNENIVDFIIFSLYMPIGFGALSPISRWWNIIFAWEHLHSLCSGELPIGTPNKKRGAKNAHSRTLYIKYSKSDKKLYITRPTEGSKKNTSVELTEYCDGLNRDIWDKYFPEII